MMNVASESSRMDKLDALNKSPPHCMLPFVQSGGVEILAKWLRKSEKVRCACLMVLPKLPVTFADLQKADIIPTLEAIQSKDKIPHHRENATALMERWKAAGVLNEPPAKKPRLDSPSAAVAVATAAVPQPCTPPLETLPPARPEEIPKELEPLDPRIVQDLLDRPQLLSYLQKAPSILANLNPENLLLLLKLWRDGLHGEEEEPGALRPETVSVTVSGLAEESSEGHIQQLFFDINISPLRVSLPRESRRKKSCGTAFVVLESPEHATIAVDRLNHARFWDFDKKQDCESTHCWSLLYLLIYIFMNCLPLIDKRKQANFCC